MSDKTNWTSGCQCGEPGATWCPAHGVVLHGPVLNMPREVHESGGRTLRDHFAGQALAANRHDIAFWADGPSKKTCEDVARICYALADAMLAERNRK